MSTKTDKAEHALKLAKKTIVAGSEFSHGSSFIAYSLLSLFAYSQDGSTGTSCGRNIQIEGKT